jgi:hypothetical protein
MQMKTELPDFDRLAELEPGLKALLKKAEQTRDRAFNPSFCANDLWFREFKPQLVLLVGWTARKENPEIQSAAAYDLAYDRIYASLPDCRECGCLRTGAGDSQRRRHVKPVVDAQEIFEHIAKRHFWLGCRLQDARAERESAKDGKAREQAESSAGMSSTEQMVLRDVGRYIIGDKLDSDVNPFDDGMDM